MQRRWKITSVILVVALLVLVFLSLQFRRNANISFFFGQAQTSSQSSSVNPFKACTDSFHTEGDHFACTAGTCPEGFECNLHFGCKCDCVDPKGCNICGNGKVESYPRVTGGPSIPEQCDDGDFNGKPGSTCSSTCTRSCPPPGMTCCSANSGEPRGVGSACGSATCVYCPNVYCPPGVDCSQCVTGEQGNCAQCIGGSGCQGLQDACNTCLDDNTCTPAQFDDGQCPACADPCNDYLACVNNAGNTDACNCDPEQAGCSPNGKWNADLICLNGSCTLPCTALGNCPDNTGSDGGTGQTGGSSSQKGGSPGGTSGDTAGTAGDTAGTAGNTAGTAGDTAGTAGNIAGDGGGSSSSSSLEGCGAQGNQCGGTCPDGQTCTAKTMIASAIAPSTPTHRSSWMQRFFSWILAQLSGGQSSSSSSSSVPQYASCSIYECSPECGAYHGCVKDVAGGSCFCIETCHNLSESAGGAVCGGYCGANSYCGLVGSDGGANCVCINSSTSSANISSSISSVAIECECKATSSSSTNPGNASSSGGSTSGGSSSSVECHFDGDCPDAGVCVSNICAPPGTDSSGGPQGDSSGDSGSTNGIDGTPGTSNSSGSGGGSSQSSQSNTSSSSSGGGSSQSSQSNTSSSSSGGGSSQSSRSNTSSSSSGGGSSQSSRSSSSSSSSSSGAGGSSRSSSISSGSSSRSSSSSSSSSSSGTSGAGSSSKISGSSRSSSSSSKTSSKLSSSSRSSVSSRSASPSLLCGNGIVEAPEQCDSGRTNADTPGTCRTNCTLPKCGDRIQDSNEQCDDGNQFNNDFCTTSCTFTLASNGLCGDGLLQTDRGEQCDDGPRNAYLPSACRPTCFVPACGDGIVDLSEQCDDGNVTAGDGCSSFCLFDRPLPPNQSSFKPAPSVSGESTGQSAVAGGGEGEEAGGTAGLIAGEIGGYTAGNVTGGYSAGNTTGGYTAGNPWGGSVVPTAIPPATQTQTGPGLIILIATGAAAGVGYVRRRR